MDYKKQEGESFTKYHIRLFERREEYDLSLDEIADLLNNEYGSDFSESKWRKDYAQYVRWKDFVLSENMEDSELLEAIESKTKEFELAKQQFQDQRREYRAYLRHEGRIDHLMKTMLDSIKEEFNEKKPLEWLKPIGMPDVKGALTLLLSDLHKGMVTDNHWNKYDNDIFYKRLNQIAQEVLEYKSLTGVNEIHVFELGDVISGAIHRLTKLAETEDAVASTQKVAEALSELLSVLANEFEHVHYYNVKGNHDRVSARKEEEVRTESFHNFIVWYMEARLVEHKNITFHKNDVDSEIIVANILGRDYFAVHGHLDGLGKVVQDLTMMVQKFPTAIFMGHQHRNYENEIHSVDLIMNGAFGGTDDYAKDKRLTSKPHQKLLWLTSEGRKATFYINLK